MSQADAVPPSAVPAAEEGFFGKLFGLYFSPTDAFRSILARPMLLAVLGAFLALNIAWVVVWVPRVNVREYTQREMEKSTRFTEATPEQQAQALSMQTKITGVVLWILPLFVLITMLVIASVLLLLFKMFFSAPVTFKQSLAIVVWTGLATGLVTVPLMLLIMALKGDWNINPEEVVMANAAALLDRNDTAKPLYSLAGSIDLFSFWNIFLYSTGYALASRRTVGAAATVVLAAWAVWVLLRAALSQFA